MASSSTRCVSKKPGFLKVVLAKTIEDGRLDIPETFAQHYGESLSSNVFLKDPLNVTSNVKLTINDDGKLWLEDGWTEFVDRYSVEHGYLITFKYYGNSQFRVTIFDATASEIAYPAPTHKESETQPAPTDKESETQPAPTDKESETQPVYGIPDNDNYPIFLDSEESETESVFEIPDDEKPHNYPIFLDSEESETESVSQIPDDEKPDNSSIFLDSEESETESVFEIPDDEKPGNSPIFLYSDESETETEYDIFKIPHDVVTPSRKRKARSQSQARSKKTKSSTTGNRPESKRDKHVQPKLMRKLKNLLKKEGEHKAVKEAMGYETENPTFLLMMRPSYIILPLQVPVPRAFAKKYFPSTEGKVIFQVADGRTWTLKYKVYERSWQLFSGWRQFVWDNKLQLDDVCIFELIKRDEPTFKVNIYREIPIEKKYKEDFSEVLQPTPLRTIEPTEVNHGKLAAARAFKAASLFKSEDPFFHVVMTRGYVQGENVVIPKDFCTQNFANALKTVQLQVDKLLWAVVMTRKDGVCQFSDGWDAFADYHDLRVGDVCVFQMTKKRPTVLKMTTFPVWDRNTRFNK